MFAVVISASSRSDAFQSLNFQISCLLTLTFSRRYYIAARGYEFYLRVLKVYVQPWKPQVTYRKMPVTKML